MMPSPGSQVDVGKNCELPDVNLLALVAGVLGDELHVQNFNDALAR